MTIDTKFEIGDKVFLILDNKVVEKEITGVKLLAYQEDKYCEIEIIVI